MRLVSQFAKNKTILQDWMIIRFDLVALLQNAGTLLVVDLLSFLETCKSMCSLLSLNNWFCQVLKEHKTHYIEQRKP